MSREAGIFVTYSIGEFSRHTGLGIHTLRYYEQENLILPERNAKNRRCYSEQDVVWIAFIKRLKDTGMPLKEIQRYAILRAAGDSTIDERLELLVRHRLALEGQIARLQAHKTKLDEKISFYRAERDNF